MTLLFGVLIYGLFWTAVDFYRYRKCPLPYYLPLDLQVEIEEKLFGRWRYFFYAINVVGHVIVFGLVVWQVKSWVG